MLAAFFAVCQKKKKGSATEHLTALRAELADKTRRDALLESFGLSTPGVLAPLTELARCKTATEEELASEFDKTLGEGGTKASRGR